MDDLRVRFGRRVRELREARGMTLKALAREIDVNLAHLSNVEHGRYSLGFGRLEALAAALSCDVADLFTFSIEDDSRAR